MKGQSAMEYLLTYGWAILIVIIVAAALYALGVFDAIWQSPDYAELYPEHYKSCMEMADKMDAISWHFETSLFGDAICRMKLPEDCRTYEGVEWCYMTMDFETEYRCIGCLVES